MFYFLLAFSKRISRPYGYAYYISLFRIRNCNGYDKCLANNHHLDFGGSAL